MSDETHYTVLGIPETAPQGEIERRYWAFIAAYQVLSDSAQRSSYDHELAQQRRQNVAAPAALPSAAIALSPSFTLLPSARLQQADKRVDWTCLAPFAGMLLSLTPLLTVLFFFDRGLAVLMFAVCLPVTVILIVAFITARFLNLPRIDDLSTVASRRFRSLT